MEITDFLGEAAKRKASDVYLAAGAVPCMNVEGHYYPCQATQGQRLKPDDMESLVKQVMNDKQWDEFVESRESNLAYHAEGVGRFRINAFWQRGSIAMVCRRVVMKIPTMRALGLPPILRNIALSERGIVLVTGSTGSGKSTSLASMIDYRAHIRTGHIVTIEDPVEFVFNHRRSIVTQREVGIDTKSFHEALKNTLRQAPQVICIGEMRDAETVQFAMHASETGHLVLATLHSTNAILAIERILHFYPQEMRETVQKQLALNLKAVICQRLVPGIRGGRFAATEILIDTPRIRDLLAKGELGSIREAVAAENQEGMHDFDRALYKLCKQGKITQEDALQAAESSNDLQLKFRGIGIKPGSSWDDVADPWEHIPGDFDPPGTATFQKIRDNSATGGYTNESSPRVRRPYENDAEAIAAAATAQQSQRPRDEQRRQRRPEGRPRTEGGDGPRQERPPQAPPPQQAPPPMAEGMVPKLSPDQAAPEAQKAREAQDPLRFKIFEGKGSHDMDDDLDLS